MCTTNHIDDTLFAELKGIAARTGRTLAAVIHDALLDALSRRRDRERPPINLPLFRGTGSCPAWT